MSGEMPLVTLVKLKEVDERPPLSEAELSLERTLTMLCSFLSLEDLIQFLSSEGFSSLAMQPSPWVVFELGLYRNHTKTLQLIPENGHVTLADEAMTGAFSGHVWTGAPDNSLVQALHIWVDIVGNDQ